MQLCKRSSRALWTPPEPVKCTAGATPQPAKKVAGDWALRKSYRRAKRSSNRSFRSLAELTIQTSCEAADVAKLKASLRALSYQSPKKLREPRSGDDNWSYFIVARNESCEVNCRHSVAPRYLLAIVTQGSQTRLRLNYDRCFAARGVCSRGLGFWEKRAICCPRPNPKK